MRMDLRRMSLGELAALLKNVAREIESRDRGSARGPRPGFHSGPPGAEQRSGPPWMGGGEQSQGGFRPPFHKGGHKQRLKGPPRGPGGPRGPGQGGGFPPPQDNPANDASGNREGANIGRFGDVR